LKYVNRYK